MTKRLTSEKEMRFLCFLCCLAYFMSYLTRLNYAACMVELQSALGIGKSIAGLPVTMCFLSYGAGQLVCGFLGDRFSPKAFHTFLLDVGPAQFEIIEDRLDAWLDAH